MTEIPKPAFFRRRPFVAIGFVLLLAIFVLTTFADTPRAAAAISSTLNFQARLMTAGGAIVPDGNYNVEFKIFNALTSSGSSQGSCTGDSACVWTETRTSTNQVHVVNGYLTVNLGSVTSFPSTINWDQPMYLSMNIGGTGGSPAWDGEMSPRLTLTAVPYAFRAGQLATNASGFTSTLGFTTPTATDSILLPDASGTVCLQSATACGFAPASGSGSYVQLQGSSPGSAQTGNLNITGTGIAGALQAPSFDAVSGALAIGGGNASSITIGKTGSNIQTTISGTALFKTTTGNDSTAALRVQNAAGTTTVLDVDNSTAGGRVGIGLGTPGYMLDVGGDVNTSTAYRVGGVSVCDTSVSTGCIAKSGSGFYIHNQNTIQTSASFFVQGAASTVSGVLQANGADILDLKDGSGANVVSFGASGANTFQTTTNTGNALQIQAANSENIFAVGTSDANLISNPDIDTSSTGWSAQGSGTSVAQDSTYAYTGASSLKVITGTAANSGAKFSLNPVVTSPSTTYTVSFYARLAVGDNTVFNDIIARYSPSGAGTTDCNITGMNRTTLTSLGWIRFWCSFSSATTPTTSGFLLIKDTTGAAHTFWVDAVQLEASATPTTYGDGSVRLDAVVTSPVTIQNTNDSTSALAVMNTTNNNVFSVNTTNDWVQIGNAPSGSAAAAKLTFGDTCDSTPANAPAPCIWLGEADAADTDILQLHAGTGTIFSTGYNTAPTQVVAINSQSQVGGTSNSDSELQVTNDIQSPTTQVRLRANASNGNFESAGVDLWLSGFTGSDFSGTQKTFLVGSVTSGNLTVGNGTAAASPTLLVLANGNSTDPTGSNGAMYYNSSTGNFRCYQAGWQNCVGGLVGVNTATASVNGNPTGTKSLTANNYLTGGASSISIPANYCVKGRAIHIVANGVYSTTTTAEALVFSVALGSTQVGTAAASVTPTASLTNKGWGLSFDIICNAAPSASSAVIGEGIFHLASTAQTTVTWDDMSASSTTNVATNAAQTVNVNVAFSGTASSSNTVTLEQLIVSGL